MTPFLLAASILLNPSGAIDYVPGTVLQWETLPGTYVSALAFVDPSSGYAPTIHTPFAAPTVQRFADKDLWTFVEDDVVGAGCRAQLDFYRLGATLFTPSHAVLINYGSTCADDPICEDCIWHPPVHDCGEGCEWVIPQVPEPATWLSALAGLVAAIFLRRQR